MSDLPKGRCPHCKSPEMQYYGFTFGGMHFFYKCASCHNYVEYYTSTKKLLLPYIVILLGMAFVIVITFSLLEIDKRWAIIFFTGSIILSFYVSHRYRWYGFKKIALKDLPSDLFIIRVPSKRLRLIILVIVSVALLAYASIGFFNLAQ